MTIIEVNPIYCDIGYNRILVRMKAVNIREDYYAYFIENDIAKAKHTAAILGSIGLMPSSILRSLTAETVLPDTPYVKLYETL